ncbi:uncharacterized protein LOC116032021 [Ipomoea triloba]|uniref:uncharacterized protein LOC116032021 n=1 Tax=Ipomoea triloba TaxID=35885 RepID=UPI00125E1354|nr:uncharacterized protein LOC116032021 [Ipomoea triloba]
MIGGAISLEGLGLQVVEDVQEADFILAHGTEAIGLRSGVALPMKLEDLEKILKSEAFEVCPESVPGEMGSSAEKVVAFIMVGGPTKDGHDN